MKFFYEKKLSEIAKLAVQGRADFNVIEKLRKDSGKKVYQMQQCHSDICLDLNDQNVNNKFEKANQNGLPFDEELSSDAIVFNEDSSRGSIFAVKTADCLPILVKNSTNYALIHAGWRGLQQKIFTKTIEKMSLDLSQKTEIFVGPHASPEKYEISEDILVDFPLAVCLKNDQKLFLDLQSTLNLELKALNLNYEIQSLNICTISNTEFYSYRRNNAEKNRNYLFVIID